MTLKETIEQQVVNDYFTPNIKAEVILDTLLTPYIPQILKTQCSIDARFLTKEMSMEEHPTEDDRGAKIDYVLEGNKNVYLVELKTTTGSIKTKQAGRYLQYCCDKAGKPQTFGKVFGNKLLRIINEHYKKYIPRESQQMTRLDTVFQAITGVCKSSGHEEHARQFLKTKKLSGTHKYLYTAGQILDNCSDLDALWEKELQLIYITPYGTKPHSELLAAKGFYLPPTDTDNLDERSSIDLMYAVRTLQPKTGDEEFVALLKSIVKAIYGAEEILPCQS